MFKNRKNAGVYFSLYQMSENTIQLTKTKFLSAVQCLKKFYLEIYKPDIAATLSSSELAIINESIEIGKLARNKFNEGVLIDAIDLDKAIEKTWQAIENNNIKTIFEPAFRFKNIFLRPDIIIKDDNNCFNIIEVKSATNIKKYFKFDLGIQYYVLRNLGFEVSKAFIMYIDSGYIYRKETYDLDKLFKIEDLTIEMDQIQSEIENKLFLIQKAINNKNEPDISVGKHCKKPFLCPFLKYCLEGLENPIIELPRISDNLLNILKELGITEISDISEGVVKLSDLQQRVRDVVITGKPFFDKKIHSELDKLNYPINFLDFEAFNPALPIYFDTKPYQMIPFQWSNHILYKNGKIFHKEFLHLDVSLPYQDFITSLINNLNNGGSIIVFSGFESVRMKEIAINFLELQPQINSIIDRLIDLQLIIKKYFYFPEFHGSYSLKKVLPSLIPELSYENLAITDGSMAAMFYKKLINKNTSQQEKNLIKEQLLAYCKLDTLAMLELYKYFKGLR
ncbi:MAG: DUF2779 domain-containing protein [Cyanobacteriota bacterium]